MCVCVRSYVRVCLSCVCVRATRESFCMHVAANISPLAAKRLVTYNNRARCLTGPFGVSPCLCSKPHVRIRNKRPMCLGRSVSVRVKPHVRISHQLSTLSHTKCLCWIVPGSRATFSASCTIFGEIQRSHSRTDDSRDRAHFVRHATSAR